MSVFSDNLRAARIAAGLTQLDMAERALGQHYDSAYQTYEYGRVCPSVSVAHKFANETHTTLDALTGLSVMPVIDAPEGAQFHTRLKIARQTAGLTQLQVAQAMGWRRYTNYSHYERGTSIPSVDLAARMAQVLGVSLDSLCAGGFTEKKCNKKGSRGIVPAPYLLFATVTPRVLLFR